MSNAPRITYTPRPEATPETEVVALAAVYRFLLFDRNADRHNEKKAPNVTSTDGSTDGDHLEGEVKNGSKPRPWPTRAAIPAEPGGADRVPVSRVSVAEG